LRGRRLDRSFRGLGARLVSAAAILLFGIVASIPYVSATAPVPKRATLPTPAAQHGSQFILPPVVQLM